ncbi:phosphatidylinositol 4-kinase B, partial [Tremellales sp. Uapishka_1]
MSHALLLRLFLSPYFSISVAMHYLKTYPDSIGISHYLCWRMKSMPAEEVEFYWPQMCHLLITRPTPSNALETFILQRAEESTHSAMLTFWFMQAALTDLTPARLTNPRPFLICQRVLHKCHEIIFGDPPAPSRSPYRSLPHSPPNSTALLHSSMTMGNLRGTAERAIDKITGTQRQKVNAHIPPALVGMGVMLASSPGMKGLMDLAGDWAISQGRKPRDDEGETRARVELELDGGADIPRETKWKVRDKQEDSDGSSEEDQPVAPTNGRSKPTPPRFGRAISDQDSQQSGPSTAPVSTFHHPAATAPTLYSPKLGSVSTFANLSSPPPKGNDPFSQSPPMGSPSPVTPPASHQPFYSVPEFSTSQPHQPRNTALRRLHPSDRSPPAEALLATYALDAQRQLLRSHYCRSEVRFLLVLEDISNRLLVVPKPARVSALRAELTSLNHNLPAEVCMPLWCAADHSHEEGGQTPSGTVLKGRSQASRKKAHARVVRISPGDSVVLNSAERAPFLLHVEILEGDLDFDPARRENRELLKKIVVQEDLKRRNKVAGTTSFSMRDRPPLPEGFGAPMPEVVPPMSNNEGHARKPSVALLSAQRKDVDPSDMEEMDLVEQLYGAKLSVRDALPDLSESIPLPSAPKNKQLDVAAWDRSDAPLSSRRSSVAGTPHQPAWTPEPSAFSPTFGQVDSSILETPAGFSPRVSSEAVKRTITLEDYSERMRTAAVMLAQLNASLVPTAPEANQSSSPTTSRSWIPGTGWITGSGKDTSPGQEATSAGGKLKLAAAQAAAIRERIMEEMIALEEERVARMTDRPEGVEIQAQVPEDGKTAEDEGIVRRELNKADPSAAVFRESWTAKKSRIRASSPWGHLANWDVISVIVKTGADLRQEQLATQLIERFSRIWKEEKCDCFVRFFRILITGESSGLVETITDAVSVHSIKKGEYARRIAEGGFGHVSLLDHYVNTYGKPDSGRFARAQRNFIKSLAGYSVVTYLLQIKDRHNGNILVDRDGHLIHIDFGFMLSNSPGNMGFEAAPFKFPMDYVEILGGLDSAGYAYFKKLFKEGFEAARKHSDSLIAIVELMQKGKYSPASPGTGTDRLSRLETGLFRNVRRKYSATFPRAFRIGPDDLGC